MMKRLILICLVLILVLSLSACDVDWSKFDLTKHNFGLTDDISDTESASDSQISSADSAVESMLSDDIINYTVPENNNVVYNQWVAVDAEDFRSMAQDKLLEMADLISKLSALKADLSGYTSISAMSTDESFAKTLNNIRAWSYGARNYPTENLSEEDLQILDKLILIGVDSAEYGAKLPSLVITYNNEMAGTYEDLIISQIVELDSILG